MQRHGDTHRFPEMDGFSRRNQMVKLSDIYDFVHDSEAARRVVAEYYVGLPPSARAGHNENNDVLQGGTIR